MSKMPSFFRLILLLQVLLATVVACHRPISHPETLDPIYADLVKQQAKAKADLEAHKASLSRTLEEMDSYPARDPRLKRAIRERFQRERAITRAEQILLYYDIRVEQRKSFVKRDYLKSFHANQAWPDPEEYKAYQVQKKLQTASRNWEDRVPKTTRYNSARMGQLNSKDQASEGPPASAEKSSNGGH